MAIGPGPIGEVSAGLRQAWTDAKTSFSPVVKEMKGLPKKALEASKKTIEKCCIRCRC